MEDPNDETEQGIDDPIFDIDLVQQYEEKLMWSPNCLQILLTIQLRI